MKSYVENWRKITSDERILDIVQHCHIEFDADFNEYDFQGSKGGNFSKTECQVIENEISNLLEMNVISEVQHTAGEIISPIFIVPKKNGDFRMIHNLKKLNEKVSYYHFKMDTFESSLHLIRKDVFMASVDVRHAYYMVPIAVEQQKFLRFVWKGKLYSYTCLPNGISCAPRLYTKLMKPVYATLRQLGHTNSGYIDDSLLVADTFEACSKNINDTVDLMTKLGFIIHEIKSVLVPTTKIMFLGNWIDSVAMIVYLPTEKVFTIVNECRKLASKDHATIRQVARVLGLMVSSFSAVEYGPLYYRNLELAKIQALKFNTGNYDAIMPITSCMKDDLFWWVSNLADQKRYISHGNPDVCITSDASSVGWGATNGDCNIGGRWKQEELQYHINYLELLAIFLALKAFCGAKSNIHVQLKTDNTCAMSYINAMGGIKSSLCNTLAKQIWLWCLERNIWISAAHVPGILNEADILSRKFNDSVEWMLNKHIFMKLIQIWGEPDIDLMASRINKQLPRYISWRCDPEAENVDAFSVSWASDYLYCFPPFSLIMRSIRKLKDDQGECLFVFPLWTTQIWWTPLLELAVDYPRIIPKSATLLSIPGTNRVHPLHKTLTLIACRLSGKPFKIKTFQESLLTSLWGHGDIVHRSSMLPSSKDGYFTVVKGKLMHFMHL